MEYILHESLVESPVILDSVFHKNIAKTIGTPIGVVGSYLQSGKQLYVKNWKWPDDIDSGCFELQLS